MTPLPKRRWSTQRQGKRRATLKAVSHSSVKCSNCGELKIPHVACAKCGFYNGKKVLTIKTKKAKKTVENQN